MITFNILILIKANKYNYIFHNERNHLIDYFDVLIKLIT